MSRELSRLWLLPTLLFVFVVALISLTSADLQIADAMFALEGHDWVLRGAFLTQTVIHEGGRRLSLALVLALAMFILVSRLTGTCHQYRGDLTRVLVTALICVALINLLKAVTGTPCPWHLIRYGGDTGLITPLAGLLRGGSYQCFPAGHVTAAYGWLGAYFFARKHFPHYRYQVLVGVLGTGILFGLAQQARGAHFFSHDLWTLWLCWTIAYCLKPQRAAGKEREPESESPGALLFARD